MKKGILLLFLLLFCMMGCQSRVKDDKTAVVYFSATSHTEAIAKKITKKLNCSLFEIVPKEKYTNEDLNYQNPNSRVCMEHLNLFQTVEIEPMKDFSQEDYETIYLGYPIWWGFLPKVVITFCNTYSLEHKKVIPFCTSESTDISGSVIELKTLLPNADVEHGKRFPDGTTQKEIDDWINEIQKEENENMKIDVFVNGKHLSATLENNSSAKQFYQLLKEQPLTIQMDDYGSFEKVGSLEKTLVRNDEYITTSSGDIILYQGNQITIYYDVNRWNFTRLGKIDEAYRNSLKELLGEGSVEITFSVLKK